MIEVPLTGGGVALLDDEDAWILRVFKTWQLGYNKRDGNQYAKRGGHRMHRLVMGLDMDGYSQTNIIVDHINGNGLDNRRCNLRICTHQQNMMNRKRNTNNKTGFGGVTPLEDRGRYRARICVEGRRYSLGCYKTAEEAGAAVEAAAKKLHGEFYREGK